MLRIAEDGHRRPAKGPTSPGGRARPPGLWPPGGSSLVVSSPNNFIYSKIILRKFSGLLELCRIGYLRFAPFRSRIPVAGILRLHVNLVK
jgi:hypothetical protein